MRALCWLATVLVIAGTGLMSGADTAAGYTASEKTGFDWFNSEGVVDLLVDTNGDAVLDTPIPDVLLVGPTRVKKSVPAGDDGNDPRPGEPDGLADIETEIVNMVLTGTLPLLGTITVRVGSDFGLPPSTGAVEEQAPGTDFPADSFFDVFFELIGTPYGPLTNFPPNSPSAPVRLTATLTDPPRLPPFNIDYTSLAGVELKDASGMTRVLVTVETHTPKTPIGGTTELLVHSSDAPASAADSAGSSAPLYAALAGFVAAATLALAGGGWYARRRFLQRRI